MSDQPIEYSEEITVERIFDLIDEINSPIGSVRKEDLNKELTCAKRYCGGG